MAWVFSFEEDMGAGAFTYDDSYWPLLLLRLEGKLSDQEFEKFFAHGHATLGRREQYVSVFDLSRTVLPSGEQRQKQILWMREHEPLLRDYLLGTAFVVSSPFLRVTLSLLFHVAPTPAPHVVVSTMDEGVAWAVARLSQSGFSAQAEHIRLRYVPRR
jgi:hypothetical protein